VARVTGIRQAEADLCPKTGIVFSSGFFGFFAHAGFLSALRETGIGASGYAGSSSGAILAAMGAAGMPDSTIRSILFDLKKDEFWDPDPSSSILRYFMKGLRGYTGYLRGNGFVRLLGQIPFDRIEDLRFPLAVTATNLTLMREEIFTHGDLKKALHASGAVPGLFKPVEIDRALFVDGGMVNKAPVQAMADLIDPKRIIVHFIASDNLGESVNGFLTRRMTPWHIYELAVNISRQEAYRRQCDMIRGRGIEIVEIHSDAVSVGPNRLHKGSEAYEKARTSTRRILSRVHP
jgi:NTE family protein